MTVTVYRDQAAFDAGCCRTGDTRADGSPIWADYEPGEVPDCDACDTEIAAWPVVAVLLPRLHERVILCRWHAGEMAYALRKTAALMW